ncbi:MAG: NusG domain II-containing protein, partial [Spirochaetaceae bacterium]|nr:NusG domain II-containing protein [Spirochaetaceae bacterium]
VTGSVFWSSAGRNGELRAEIEASGELYIMPLSRDGYLDLEGPVGNTRVEVSDGEVFISDSDCRDKICIAMGHVSSPSGWIACLPNRVFVRVIAMDSDSYPGEEVDSGAF